MAHSSIKVLLAVVTSSLLISCVTIIDGVLGVEDESNVSLVGKPKPRNTASEKQLAKQREQLKKEGKCPTCRGMGKTPDGLYVCETCKGTGKYNETKNQ